VCHDGSETRELLLDVAQYLFARHGIYRVTLRRIVQLAGQHNPSVIHYHFGGREGLLRALIVRHDGPLRRARAELLARFESEGRGDDPRSLAEALIVPLSADLATTSGRQHLQIASQLSVLFDFWDVRLPGGPTETQRLIRAMGECTPPLDPALRKARIVNLLGLVTEALAARARSLEQTPESVPTVDDDVYATNLVDMTLGALLAPSTTIPAG
jgi:AcrR family transcriptional regulator